MKFANNARVRAMAACLLLAVPLAACGDSATEEAATEAGEVNDTLAVALASGEDLSTVSEAMNDIGLSQVFDGTAAYTILAPTDPAFAQLSLDEELDAEARNALLAATLREHVLPGALTTEDIAAAIESQQADVVMNTMGSGKLTFSADGDNIRVTDETGASAMLAKEPILASNGVAIPIDAVLHAP